MIQSPSATPFFTILVPTYNQARFLPDALDSLIGQTDPDWEAIVVNDGSTDATAEVLADYAVREPRIRVFHQANGGVAAALNAGLAEARGRWICWLSSDDMFKPDKLAINRREIAATPDIAFYFSYFTLRNEKTGETTDCDLWGPLPDPRWPALGLFRWNYVNGISICAEKAAWDRVGRFDVDLRYGQDYDLWLRYLAGFDSRFIPQWTVVSRHHPDQDSERFPLAGLCDSARAAMMFLARTGFEACLPDSSRLSETDRIDLLRSTLDLASDGAVMLYRLGHHPLLLWRLLEWWSAQPQSFRDKTAALLSDHVRRCAGRRAGPEQDAMWEAALVALDNGLPPLCPGTIDPVATGLAHWRRLAARGDDAAPAYRRYLVERLKLPESRVVADGSGRVGGLGLYLTGPISAGRIAELAEQADRRGLALYVVHAGAPGLTWHGSALVVGLGDAERVRRAHRDTSGGLPRYRLDESATVAEDETGRRFPLTAEGPIDGLAADIGRRSRAYLPPQPHPLRRFAAWILPGPVKALLRRMLGRGPR